MSDTSAHSSIRELGTVLGIWAHPDDEVYMSGGVMAAARDAGQRVICLTASLGEHGTSDPRQWPPRRLARVRALELHASLAVLGVTEHHLLGIRDGACADQDFQAVVGRLVEVIDEVQPDTILTFGPDGFTGHRDHQAVSRWATAARARAGGNARLLYAAATEEFIDEWQHVYDRVDVFLADGLPVRHPLGAVDLQLRLRDEAADRKLVALRAQATQTSDLVARLGERTMRDWCSVESFIDADAAAAAHAWASWWPRFRRG